MIKITNLHLDIDNDMSELKGMAAKKLRISQRDIHNLRLVKKSVDARDKAKVQFVCTVELETEREEWLVQKRRDRLVSVVKEKKYQPISGVNLGCRPVVAGFGPAGMFAALILAQAGQRPIVIERGQAVEYRQKTVERFWNSGLLDPESNVQFGEGGAGTFSDGKLTTGTKDSRIQKVLEEFAAAGAPKEILYEAKPHIGTDCLPRVVRGIRNQILSQGGEIRFDTRLTGFMTKRDKLCGIRLKRREGGVEETLACTQVILATGHSARDIFELFQKNGLPMEAKAFSVGARIEHPASYINRAQFGIFAGHPALGAADYKLSCHLPSRRGVYTFCMCPGGEVTGAASETGKVVTNGMSRYRRDDVNSNAALLVSVTPKDFGYDVLDGVTFQRQIERQAFLKTGGGYAAPGQRAGDFLAGMPAGRFGLVRPSYRPEVIPTDLSCCLPGFVTEAMAEGIGMMDRQLKGFAMADAVLTAPETRSSSPVRLLRNDNRQSPALAGLFPCGEGAGYAGGIVSAAVDGIKTAEAILSAHS